MKTDYIIVGDGYAALFFAHQLIKHNKTFKLYSEGKLGASQVSAGIINPVVLKKFTTFWNAMLQIQNLHTTLSEMTTYLGKDFLIKDSIQRVLHDETEKQLWLKKRAEKEELQPFLNPEFKSVEGILNPFGTGEVWYSSRLDVDAFFSTFLDYLKKHHHLVNEKFDYNQLNPQTQTYQNLNYSHIVFAEGMGVLSNPYFKNIDIQPNKGHHIKVTLSKDIDLKGIIKKKHFLFPLAQGQYYYGGTYDRFSIDECIDDKAVAQLKEGVETIYPNDYDIVDTQYGFRPTVKDRRPMLGKHSEWDNLYVFNGLGARGILNGNYFAEILYHHIEHNGNLPEEVNWKRFSS